MSRTATAPGSALAYRLFRIQPGEGGKVALFTLLAALMQAGVTVGVTASDALFLSNIGIEQLPYIYLAILPVLGLYVLCATYLLGHLGIERTLLLVLGIMIAGGALLFLGLRVATGDWIHYVAKLYASLWYIGLYTLFWNFADSFFDIRDAKRLFAFFSGGYAAGAMVGGVLVAVLSRTWDLGVVFLVWSSLCLMAVPVVGLIAHRFRVLAEAGEEDEPKRTVRDQLLLTGNSMRRSRYVLVLTLALLSVFFLTSLVEYQYFGIFSRDASEEELASLFGRLFAAVNAFNLLVNLFVFNRLVLVFGVRRVALVQPIAYLATFALLLLHGGPAAAVFGFFALHGVLNSIDSNNLNFLFNALPGATKKEVRTLLEGLAEPLATALAGAFLLAVATRFGPPQISAVGFALAGVFLVVVLALCAEYLRSMVSNLKQEWLDLSRPAQEVLCGLDCEALRVVVDHARDPQPEVARCAISLLWRNNRALAQEATLDHLERAAPGQLPAATPLVSAILADGEPAQVRRLVQWAQRHSGSLDASCLAVFARHGLLPDAEVVGLLRSQNPRRVAVAVTALWNSGRPEDRCHAAAALHDLLCGPDDTTLTAGLEALGTLQEPAMAHQAASLLGHRSAQVRRQALRTLPQMVSRESSALVPALLAAIRTGEDGSRNACFQALTGIDDPTCIPPLLAMSTGLSPPERRGIYRMIRQMGLKGVPGAVAVLRDPFYPYSGRAIAARSLAAVAFPQLASLSPVLIEQAISRAERFNGNHRLLATPGSGSSGLTVLARFYADMQRHVVDFILEVLTLDGRLPDFELLSTSLRSSSPKERANAMETIEHSVGRAVFKRLGPLLDPALGAPAAAANGPGALLLHALESPFPLEAAAAAQALLDTTSIEAKRQLQDRLRRPHTALLRDTVLALCRSGSVARTFVDRVAHLAAAPFFTTLPVWDLERLASASGYLSVRAGAPLCHAGKTPGQIFVMVAGCAHNDAGLRFEAGSLVGEAALRMAPAWPATVLSGGAEVLAVPLPALTEAIRGSATFGMELLRFRMEACSACTA